MYNKHSNYNRENGFIEILAISGHKKKQKVQISILIIIPIEAGCMAILIIA